MKRMTLLGAALLMVGLSMAEELSTTHPVTVSFPAHEAVSIGSKGGNAAGVLLGVVGAATTIKPAFERGQKLLSYAKENGITLEDIVSSEYQSALSAGEPGLIEYGGRLSVEIVSYQMNIKNGFTDKLNSFLMVTAEYTGPNGEVAWKGKDQVSFFNKKTPEYTYEELMSDPEKIKDLWKVLGSESAAAILKKLERSR